jgi:hypothetical protein
MLVRGELSLPVLVSKRDGRVAGDSASACVGAGRRSGATAGARGHRVASSGYALVIFVVGVATQTPEQAGLSPAFGVSVGGYIAATRGGAFACVGAGGRSAADVGACRQIVAVVVLLLMLLLLHLLVLARAWLMPLVLVGT